MLAVPALPRNCNSWVIAKDGKAVCELFDRKNVEAIAANPAPGVEIFTTLDWLVRLNARIKAGEA